MFRSKGIWSSYPQEGTRDANLNKLDCFLTKLVSASNGFKELALARACFGLE